MCRTPSACRIVAVPYATAATAAPTRPNSTREDFHRPLRTGKVADARDAAQKPLPRIASSERRGIVPAGSAPGLRERKKIRTRAAIQQHALRLFRDRGYEATTVQEIAEAVEVSECTFFCYFPAKEDFVLWDPFDPLLVQVFRNPARTDASWGLPGRIRQVLARLTEAERAEQRERVALLLSVPPLRAMLVHQLAGRAGGSAWPGCGLVKAWRLWCRSPRRAGLFVAVQIRASTAGVWMSSMTRAFNRPPWLAAMDSERTATPSPRMARSATAPGALACSAISGCMPWAAQAWSNTARTPVPSGMHTIGYALMSARVTRGRPARGWPGGTAATSRSLTIVQRAQPRRRGAGRSDEGQVCRAGAHAFDEPV